MNKTEVEKDRVLRRLVDREILHCVSSLIYELTQSPGVLDEETSINLWRGIPDYEQAATDAGWQCADTNLWINEFGEEQLEEDARRDDVETWMPVSEGAYYHLDLVETCEAEDWEELCYLQSIEPIENEVSEHWLVTKYFGEELEEHGERVVELHGLTIWCRTTSGQMIAADYIIEEIASSMEILPEQRNDWSK